MIMFGPKTEAAKIFFCTKSFYTGFKADWTTLVLESVLENWNQNWFSYQILRNTENIDRWIAGCMWSTHVFIHSFNKYLLPFYYVPVTLMKNIDYITAVVELAF